MAGDAYWASVSLLQHGYGTNGATVSTGNGPVAKASTFNGTAQISTSRIAAGEFSFGANGFVSFADHADFELGSGDFTIDAKVYLTSYAASSGGDYNACVICKDVSGSRGFNLMVTGTVSSYTGISFAGFSNNTTSTTVAITHALSLNTEYAIRVVRSGSLMYIFIDGVLQNIGGTAFTVAIQDTTALLKLGALYYDAGVTYNYYVNGRAREVRITKGTARSTANYSVDTNPLPDGLGQVSGVIRDAANAVCARTVRAYRRDTGALAANVTSDAGTGAYSFYTPTLDELTVLALDNQTSGTYYDDEAIRVIPA